MICMIRKIPTSARFEHRGWSIRRFKDSTERLGYGVWRKGQRSWGAYNQASTEIVQSSDGTCWFLRRDSDARTEFWAALDLAIDNMKRSTP